MKVQNITDIEGFFKVVDSCEGKVELVIPELEIVAHEPEDIDKLVKFMLLGNGKED